MDTPLTRFIDALNRVGLDGLDPEQVADIAWLAAHLGQGEPTLAEIGHQEEEPITQPWDSSTTRQPPRPAQSFEPGTPEPPATPTNEPIGIPQQTPSEPTVELYTSGAHEGTLQSGVAVYTPGGSALPHFRQLTRILRPLRRRVMSHDSETVDEEATAQRIAAAGARVWLPVMQPQVERWLELAMIRDLSPSMRVWDRTVAELQRLLNQLGAFRDIRHWSLHTGGKDQRVALRSCEGAMSRHHKELVNPSAQRLIMVVSDCVSPAWEGEELLGWLRTWGRIHPVVIVQMLPQHLWSQTRFNSVRHVKSTSISARANHLLGKQIRNNPWESQSTDEDRLALPVTTLESNSLIAWIRFFTGASDVTVPALIGKARTTQPNRIQLPSEVGLDRLEKFRQVASPLAFRLACYLAAAPLRLPIMRLVQQVMLAQSNQSHLAEFFLSGLIQRVSPLEITDPEEIDYEFIGQIREELLSYTLQTEAFQVQAEVSDFISEHYGIVTDFFAVQASDTATSTGSRLFGRDYFASVRRTVLQTMGQPETDESLEKTGAYVSGAEGSTEPPVEDETEGDAGLAEQRLESVKQLEFTPRGRVYPSPADWRDQFMYFLLVDRFDDHRVDPPPYNPDTAPKGRDPAQGSLFQGGTIRGVTRRLDYIKNLGCTVVWLSPIFKNRQEFSDTYYGYGVQDFLQIDPRFGSTEDLQELVRQAHARNMYVILDAVINFTGDNWSYPQDYPYYFQQDAPRPYDFGFWREVDPAPGYQEDDAVWPIELQSPDAYKRRGEIRNWADPNEAINGDLLSLKRLNTENREVLDTLIKVYQYWVAVSDVDGFRLDTVKHIEATGVSDFCDAVHSYARRIGKMNFLIFGEIVGDDQTIHQYLGRNTPNSGTHVRFPSLDAALDFPLHFVLEEVIKGMANPSVLRDRYDRFRTLYADQGEAGLYFVTFVDNQDQITRPYRRFMHNNPFPQQGVLAVAYLLTSQGIPFIYYGTEQGFDGGGDNDRYVRECMFGGQWGAFDTTGVHFFNDQHHIYKSIQEIARVRTQQPALRYGAQYFREVSVDGEHFFYPNDGNCTLAFSRILDTDEVLVCMNLQYSPRNDYITVDKYLTPPGSLMINLLDGTLVKVEESAGRACIQLPTEGHQFAVLKLNSA